MPAAPAWSAVAALVVFELVLGAGAPLEPEDPLEVGPGAPLVGDDEPDDAPLVGPGAVEEELEPLPVTGAAFAAAENAA
jgi:hypothetical protein